MKTFLEYVKIENFKSIKDTTLAHCNRINLLIGRPNVGKSNILEAIGLLGLPYIQYDSTKKLTNFIRLENEPEVFFDGDNTQKIIIETNIAKCTVEYSPAKKQFLYSSHLTEQPIRQLHIELCSIDSEIQHIFLVNDQLKIRTLKKGENVFSIKKYSFAPNIRYKKSHVAFLIPPYGKNLLHVIPNTQKLYEELSHIFNEYGLLLVFDKASQSLKIMKTEGGQHIFLMPYTSIADTLQRIIFFKTAIVSNANSVILFEEPEAHSFPPYIVHITQEIIHSRSNQFFISTHSPYIINDFLENCREELSVFVADFKGGETIIKRLSQEELDDMYHYGVDLFMNTERYL